MRSIPLLALLLASLCHAFQLPFEIGNIWPTHKLAQVPGPTPPSSPRIAIIGAGAGGSSAAFWISKAKERHGLDVAVDIFERSDYVGGRKLNISNTVQLWLISLKEALQFTHITAQHTNPWNSAHLSL